MANPKKLFYVTAHYTNGGTSELEDGITNTSVLSIGLNTGMLVLPLAYIYGLVTGQPVSIPGYA